MTVMAHCTTGNVSKTWPQKRKEVEEEEEDRAILPRRYLTIMTAFDPANPS